jgi:hypothetical protein
MHTPIPSAHACTPPAEGATAERAPYTLRFTHWQCGHHGQRPADIPVHSIEQAQLILNAIGCAITQPGHAWAVVYDDEHYTTPIRLTDDHADPVQQTYGLRTVVFHGTAEEIAELPALAKAHQDCFGGIAVHIWDGKTHLDDHSEVATTLSIEAINAATQPVEWHEGDTRKAVCNAPPVLRPVAELLAELREHATYLAEIDAEEATEQGGTA